MERSTQDLFAELLSIVDPAQREVTLQRLCCDDEQRRNRLRRLLSKVAATEGDDAGIEEHAPLSKDDILGGFQIIERIGGGGFGDVYTARQSNPDRVVAVKVINTRLNERTRVAFTEESRKLARMQHPGICIVHHSGIEAPKSGSDLERPFFVMEYIDGRHLDDACDEDRLTLDQRITLMAKVCDALQYAHGRGIIHRDLKPENILVLRDKETGELQPKVIDFGIAKAEDAEEDATRGAVTRGYTSPEQASGDEVDARSDVYVLGVILYTLLVGEHPFPVRDADENRGLSGLQAEIARMKSGSPEPSTGYSRLSAKDQQRVAGHRSMKPGPLKKALGTDLQCILGKALAPDPEERYQTAKDLGDDLRGWMAGHALSAGPETARYRAGKFVRRNRVLVGLSSAFALALLASLATMTWLFTEAESQRELAEAQKTQAEEARAEATKQAEIAVAKSAEAELRSSELEQVVDFQRNQLLSLDAQKMGTRLREDLISNVHTTLKSQNISEEEIKRSIDTLTEKLDGINLTDVSQSTIERNIVKPTLKAIEKDFLNQPMVAAKLTFTIGMICHKLGITDILIPSLQTALITVQNYAGEEHPSTVSYLDMLGFALIRHGQLDEGEEKLRSALAISQRYPSKELETARILKNIGNAKLIRGQFDEAESFIRQALEINQARYGDSHENTLSLLSDLAGCFKGKRQFDQARKYYEKVLVGRQQLFGNDDRYLIDILGELGNLYRRMGDRKKGDEYVSDALTRAQRLLGESHPYTVTLSAHACRSMFEKGKYQEALSNARLALERMQRFNWFTLQSTFLCHIMDTICLTLTALGDYKEALKYSDECLKEHRKVGDEIFNHSPIFETLWIRGVCLLKIGDLTQAEECWIQAVEGYRKLLGPEDPVTLSYSFKLANLLRSQEKYPQALSYYVAVAEIELATLNNRDLRALNEIAGTGQRLTSEGQPALGNEYARQQLALAKNFKLEGAYLFDATNNLSQSFRGLKDSEKYIHYAEEGLRISEQHFDLNTLNTALAKHNLAICYAEATKNFEDSLGLIRDAIEIRSKELGDTHPETNQSRHALGWIYVQMGQYPEAATVLEEVVRNSSEASDTPDPLNMHYESFLHSIRMELERYEDALPHLEETLKKHQHLYGEEHRDTLIALYNFAFALKEMARYRDSEPYALDCEIRNRSVYGPSDQETLDAVDLLISLYDGWHRVEPDGDYDIEAQKWRDEVTRRTEAATGTALETTQSQ